MGWFTSLFSLQDNSQHTRKGQALSSTHEAFSLQTSSPTRSPTSVAHLDTFHPEALQTPDPESSMTPSYTYPPQGSGAYGYVPTSTGLNSRPVSVSLLPTHHEPTHTLLSPKFQYPPLSTTWNRLRTWLDREYPELGDTLNYGILPPDLAQIEMQFGFALPPAVRDSYLCVNGQEAESAAGCSEGLFFGLKFLPLEEVLEEWRFWREVDDDPATGGNPRLREAMQSIPPGWVRKEYSQRGWIPLIADKVGNYIGIDLNPDEKGSVGQVIVFGRDFDTKVVLFVGDGPAGWAKWLASFVDELESGEGIEIGLVTDGSDGSEDDLGYESYFYEGNGRGQGDGGGDTGSGGGLRLVGEYRGWDVLEALADRSLRRWHEAGVIIDTSISPAADESKQLPEHIVLDLTNESSVQVGIPILADDDDPIPAPSIASSIGQFSNAVQKQEQQEATDLPTISITRAPAPLPVELPTEHDIMPAPVTGSSQSSFDEDLESGRSIGMRESPNLVPSSKRSQAVPSSSREPTDIAGTVHSVSSPPLKSRSPTPLSPSISQKANIPDLLADSAPALDTLPITPTSPHPQRSDLPTTAVKESATSDAQDVADAVDEDPSSKPASVEEVDPNATIRLVGGGGTVGVVNGQDDETPYSEGVETDTDVSVTSQATESTPKAAKTHKKTKSGLAGLKKLGKIGRKHGSNSDLKDTHEAGPMAS